MGRDLSLDDGTGRKMLASGARAAGGEGVGAGGPVHLRGVAFGLQPPGPQERVGV